jgi:hypothetical protein
VLSACSWSTFSLGMSTRVEGSSRSWTFARTAGSGFPKCGPELSAHPWGLACAQDLYNLNVKTIAITIDEEALADLDRLAKRCGAARSRIVRLALREYLVRAERAAAEARERDIIRRHRARLQQQAAALVKEQAKP